MITVLTLLALGISATIYLGVALGFLASSRNLSDHIPMADSGEAVVRTSGEFSAATVATSISLATVVLAFTELAGTFGLWLMWSVATTVVGILVVRWFAPIIWERLQSAGVVRPTLHEFLGTAFDSKALTVVAAVCTALGFLGALAVELSVGSRFLVSLAPSIPSTAAVIVLATVGVTYTLLGGFRVVIVTDRIQMMAIWVTIAILLAAIAWEVVTHIGVSAFAKSVPASMYDFSSREGLFSFVIGLALLNIPTFLSDMSIWQRIAACRNIGVVTKGLIGSAVGAAISWTSLVMIACAISVIMTQKEGVNPLASYLVALGSIGSIVTSLAFVVIVAGLYAASLSTASTQLIAAGHTLHTDLLRASSDKQVMASSNDELHFSRILLIVVAVVAIGVVELLQAVGFSIADLVFAVYGAQLALVPVVILALFGDPARTKVMGPYATGAVLMGFVTGWVLAAYGKIAGNGDLVFLSPVGSCSISAVICVTGILLLSIKGKA